MRDSDDFPQHSIIIGWVIIKNQVYLSYVYLEEYKAGIKGFFEMQNSIIFMNRSTHVYIW